MSAYDSADPLIKRHLLRAEGGERQTQFWQWLFRLLGIQRMIALDDSRHTGELRLACKREGIETLAYMHARFNKYHVGLSKPCFDKYLVGSIVAGSIEQMNEDYKNSQIVVSGHPRLTSTGLVDRLSMTVRILWLEESNIDYRELNAFADALNQMEGRSVFPKQEGGPKMRETFGGRQVGDWVLDDSTRFYSVSSR